MARRTPARLAFTPVEATEHADKRVNLPTADSHDFVTPQGEQVGQQVWTRDPSLDPQLIWKGKDERAGDLVVDVPPIYIQEKVDPRGVDVYDPTTGDVRSGSTDQVALWMVDAAYNEESFFVRQCYFTGGGDPYKRLRTALKAEIDPDAWASLYATTSRPFDRPDTGKIAVKVINDYGDEVVEVFPV